MHDAPLKFKARGLSASIARLREFEKMGMWLKGVSQFPAAVALLDPQKLLLKSIEMMGWYPQDVLREMDPKQPPVPPPAMPGQPFPGMDLPLDQVGGLGFLQNSANGMSQVPMGGMS